MHKQRYEEPRPDIYIPVRLRERSNLAEASRTTALSATKTERIGDKVKSMLMLKSSSKAGGIGRELALLNTSYQRALTQKKRSKGKQDGIVPSTSIYRSMDLSVGSRIAAENDKGVCLGTNQTFYNIHRCYSVKFCTI